MAHRSRSDEQRSAEQLIRARLEDLLGVPLSGRSIPLPGGSRPEVDAASADGKVVAEIYAHQGPLKGAQVHKVARDVLKLITIRRAHPGTRGIIVMADEDAAAGVLNDGWLAESIRLWELEVLVIDIPDDLRHRLRAAQRRQRMVNPSGEDELSGDGAGPV